MVTSREIEGVTIVTLQQATIDASNYKDVRAAIDAAVGSSVKVVLNLAAVEFVDSSALGSMISLLRAANDRGGELRLCGLQSRVQRLFELTRMYRVFSIWPDEDAALASLKESS